MAAEGLDVLVVGGGVTGCGAALDAAARGLAVGLVEQRDYASGTSSRSSKMFHGGLRYLEHLEFALVAEALRERNLMVERLCPHLIRPTPFVYPLGHWWERIYVGAGVLLYEVLSRVSRRNPMPWHRHLGEAGMTRLCPAASARRGVVYWDTVVDDARHTLTLARTAAAQGALLANSARVVGMELAGGKVRGVEVVDLEGGRKLVIPVSAVINATGVWTDDLERMAGDSTIDVIASKGVHLLVPRRSIDSAVGLILRTESSVLFVIPWGDHWIVGTTDTPWSLHRAHPAASRSDIEYLLTAVNGALRTPISALDVVGVYAGLRPLLPGESEHTSRLSREHAVFDRGNGLVSVAGGKYTTYRVMAADAVDSIADYLGRTLPSSSTAELPLIGATAGDEDRLNGRYGTLRGEVESLAAQGHGERVIPHAPYLRAEVVYAVTHEGALHLDDVLTRRTRLSIETTDRGVEAAPVVAEIMAGLLGWGPTEIGVEVGHYLARVRAEVDSQSQPDDHTADAARMGAPDVRTGVAE